MVLSIIYSKYKNEGEKIFKEEQPCEILKILNLVKNTWLFENNSRKHQKIKKNKSQEITLKNIDETRTFFFFLMK